MSNLPCAKVIIDNGRGTMQALVTNLAVVDRALGCMSNSILLSATADVYPTEQMEAEFVKASSELKDAIARAADKYLTMVADVSTYFDGVVTDRSAGSGRLPPPKRDNGKPSS